MTQTTTASATGLYVYAIVLGPALLEKRPPGVEGAPVDVLTEGRLSVYVSASAAKRMRPQRVHLAAHSAVMKEIVAVQTPLPVRFGHIADSEESLRKLLRSQMKTLVSQLEAVDGCFEMCLRVKWDVPNVFEYLVDQHPELAEERDRVIGMTLGGAAERSAKMELGQLFDQIVQADRAAHASRIEKQLLPSSRQIKLLPARDLPEIAQFAALVPRDKAAEFEQAVFKAANQFDDAYSFDITGPWPPHNFCNLELDS